MNRFIKRGLTGSAALLVVVSSAAFATPISFEDNGLLAELNNVSNPGFSSAGFDHQYVGGDLFDTALHSDNGQVDSLDIQLGQLVASGTTIDLAGSGSTGHAGTTYGVTAVADCSQAASRKQPGLLNGWGMSDRTAGYTGCQDNAVGVPEPAPLGLLGLGLIAITLARRIMV